MRDEEFINKWIESMKFQLKAIEAMKESRKSQGWRALKGKS